MRHRSNPLIWLALSVLASVILNGVLPLWRFDVTRWIWGPLAVLALWFLNSALRHMAHFRLVYAVNRRLDQSDIGGPFKRGRNPIYTGITMLYFAFLLWLGSLSAFLPFIAFVMIMDRYIIPEEEAQMLRRNQRKAAAYLDSSRRWF
ncbi:methyltransferase [Paracoccaceae bacterium GXU_MW_L88]